jgi:formamidopyrimidine-DNA glycosylase
MPELPEIETFARVLRPQLVEREILSVELFWNRTLATPSPKKFGLQIAGQKILAVTRRAKYLHLQLSTQHLFFHLRMSGDLWIKEAGSQPEKHDRLHLHLSDGRTVAFNDTRKFGRVWLVDDPDKVIGGLGPEPFNPDFTAQTLYEGFHQRRRQVKPLLLDQAFIAGLGNIYTDEALHLSGVHPQRISDTITVEESERLFHSIRTVLQLGIEHNGASIDWVYRGGNFQNYFRVYDRARQPCPVCGTPIQRITVGQRGTHFCPTCQVK